MDVQVSEESTRQAAALQRPRRRAAPRPPSPADPTPWEQAFGGTPLSAEEFAVLTQLARRRSVPAGESVFTDGGIAHGLVLLLSGDAVLGARDGAGALRTERSVTGPAWLDVSSAWLALPCAMEALALSDIVVAELPLAALLAELAGRPRLATRLCTMLARQIHMLTVASRNLLHNDAAARFAQWLLYRCPAGARSCELRLQERKRDIAQQLAMTPETLSRLMRTFEGRGWLSVRGYQVRVHDVPALHALVAVPAPPPVA
jgi:CRP-like cAMP-binding protein